ncbi:MAG: helix-turn-helix domain-containing protein [Clostridia bacterium]|nr:helix-turn-helix domain-containing protein [Clostridia bacterium]
MDKQIFNDNLRQIMKENNLTQKQLSEYTGIPASSIASWFGKQSSSPSIEAVRKIADHLNVTIDYLIGRESEDGRIIIEEREYLTDNERELLAKYRKLSPQKQSKVLGYVSALSEN